MAQHMEFISGNIFIRPMGFARAGDIVQSHAHNFDHVTYIVRGAVRIDQLVVTAKDNSGNPTAFEMVRTVEKRANGGHNWVSIKAGIWHRLTALEDNSLGHCIYSHRTPQGEVSVEYDGFEPSYF